MTTETYEQRVLIPDSGKYLYNAKDKIVSDRVYLGKNAEQSDWKEITQEQKAAMETENTEDKK